MHGSNGTFSKIEPQNEKCSKIVSSIIDYNYSLYGDFFSEFDFLLLMIVLFRLIAFSNISLKSVIY